MHNYLYPNIVMNLSCVYFIDFEGSIKDECPYKKDGYKPCIKLGKPCRNLQGEFFNKETLYMRQ